MSILIDVLKTSLGSLKNKYFAQQLLVGNAGLLTAIASLNSRQLQR